MVGIWLKHCEEKTKKDEENSLFISKVVMNIQYELCPSELDHLVNEDYYTIILKDLSYSRGNIQNARNSLWWIPHIVHYKRLYN